MLTAGPDAAGRLEFAARPGTPTWAARPGEGAAGEPEGGAAVRPALL